MSSKKPAENRGNRPEFDLESVDFRAFAEQSLDLKCIAGADGHFYWLNQEWTKALGWELEQLLASPFLEFVHPDDRDSTLEEVASLAKGEQTVKFRNRYRDRIGGWHWLDWTAHIDSSGYIFATARDVTREQIAAKESERRIELLNLAESFAQIGHWRVDLARPELYWSPQVYRIHGHDPETYRPTLEDGINAYHPEDRELVAAHVQKAIDEVSGFEFQLRIIRTDGDIRFVHSIGRPETDREGKVIAVFGVFQDVTDRVLQLRKQTEELEQFAYAASHDLQAPLRTIMGFGELLQEDVGGQLSEDSQSYLKRIVEGSQRMQRLVDGLLHFSNTMNRNQGFDRVELDHVVEEVLKDLELDIANNQATIEKGSLPTIWGNAGQLTSLFLNLISNSLRYRSDHPPVIEIRAKDLPTHSEITFCDNGQGFDMSYADRIFQLFRRLESKSNDPSQPLGLGLSLCQRIIEAHGGSISVNSEPGKGAQFTFTLRSAADRRADDNTPRIP